MNCGQAKEFMRLTNTAVDEWKEVSTHVDAESIRSFTRRLDIRYQRRAAVRIRLDNVVMRNEVASLTETTTCERRFGVFKRRLYKLMDEDDGRK